MFFIELTFIKLYILTLSALTQRHQLTLEVGKENQVNKNLI